MVIFFNSTVKNINIKHYLIKPYLNQCCFEICRYNYKKLSPFIDGLNFKVNKTWDATSLTWHSSKQRTRRCRVMQSTIRISVQCLFIILCFTHTYIAIICLTDAVMDIDYTILYCLHPTTTVTLVYCLTNDDVDCHLLGSTVR